MRRSFSGSSKTIFNRFQQNVAVILYLSRSLPIGISSRKLTSSNNTLLRAAFVCCTGITDEGLVFPFFFFFQAPLFFFFSPPLYRSLEKKKNNELFIFKRVLDLFRPFYYRKYKKFTDNLVEKIVYFFSFCTCISF